MGSPRSLPPNRRVRPPAAPDGVIDAPPEDFVAPEPDRPEPSARKPAASKRASKKSPSPGRFRDFMRRMQPVVGLLVVVAASIGVAWGIRHHVLTSPRFSIRNVRVEGTQRRSAEQVAETAGLKMGANIFSADPERTRIRLLQDPWIERASIKRKLPSTILVEIVEREAAAAVAIGPELYLCTHEGEPFKRIEPGDPSSLTVITGLSPEELAQDRARAIKRIRNALELLADYEQRGPSKRLPIGEVALAKDGTARLIVGKDGVTIELGVAPYRQKILRAARVLEEVERRHASPSVVFLDNEAHPERVVVRMR